MVTYEWIVEYHDVYDDIVDIDFCSSARQAIEIMEEYISAIGRVEVALVRSEYSDDDLIDKDYAYLDMGNPLVFEESEKKAPIRYQKEIENAVSKVLYGKGE